MIDEKIMQKLMQMLHERRDWYDDYAFHATTVSARQNFYNIANVYDSVCWMLDYALHGDWEAIGQYDYFGEDDDK